MSFYWQSVGRCSLFNVECVLSEPPLRADAALALPGILF